MTLEGRTALVTGASRGIGRAIALRLADRGATVVCVATTVPGLEATMAQLADRGATPGNERAFALAANVADATSVEQLIADLADKELTIDILVNNAGITRDALLMRMSDEDFDTVLAVNLRGVFLLCRSLVRSMMKKRSGAIVNIASVVGLHGNAGQANYAASKAGIIGFTKSLAKELAGRGITANVVAPGFIETDMTNDIPEVNRAEIVGSIPLGRMGQPDDIAAAVEFLVGPGGSYVTGQVLAVDGGMGI